MIYKNVDQEYYSEDELIERKQNDPKFGWFDYVYHFSPEWREEYIEFCRQRGMEIESEMNALAYIAFREDLEDEAHRTGNI